MDNPIKRALLDVIDFARFKVDTNACTPEEMQSVFRMIEENTINKATTKDIADFYGQSNANVRNIVSRWGIKGESKRYYDFNKLQKFIPKSWRKLKPTEAPTPTPYEQNNAYTNIAAETAQKYGL